LVLQEDALTEIKFGGESPDGTVEGDLVLVYMEDKPAFFARVEAIEPDVKPEWFQVKLLVLQVPLLVVTWILRVPYINGETFTMGGTPLRMEKVVVPEEPAEAEAEAEAEEAPGDRGAGEKALEEEAEAPEAREDEGAKVVSLASWKKGGKDG